jgi:hypothetical protein
LIKHLLTSSVSQKALRIIRELGPSALIAL